MKPQTKNLRKSIVPALIAISLGLAPLSTNAASLAIAETPLTVSTTVEPNVMLLMDNSGSMDNVVWAEDFDPETSYTNWSYSNYYYDVASGNNFLSDLRRGDCSSGWVEARNVSGTRKCLRLPNPEGGDTRYTGAYLNYLFSTYANGTDLRSGGQIPTDTRMTIAKNALISFVENTSGMRFGVASFNPTSMNNEGGRINAICDSGDDEHITDVTNKIGDLTALTNTPLAETLYEITRYFRGMTSGYNSPYPTAGATAYGSPIQYRCQKNFSIVVTDGLPTYDTTFPTDDPADVANTEAALRDWDGEDPATTISMYPNFPQYSDGFSQDPVCIANPSTCWQRVEGYSLYLDDIAKFGYDIDMKTTDTDVAGGSYEDPRFPQQNMRTYTIGFSIGNQMLEDAAEYGHGRYLQANNASQLTSALQNAISHVFTTSSSSSSVATNSTRLGTETRLYQARFSSLDWTGEILSFSINSNGSTQTGDDYPRSSVPEAGERSIYTFNPVSLQGVEFQWTGGADGATGLSNDQQTELHTNDSNVNDGLGIERVAYLRGDQSNEITTNAQGNSTGLFRPRNSLLGDIVNSDPHYVGTPDFRYHLLPGTEGEAYVTFRSNTTYRNRTPMLYVGANDGMLHAFDASDLIERFAYVPNGVFPKLTALTSPDYGHMYFVDGSPRSGDAYINGSWKTVLVGGLGAGGKSIYALDVTNPTGFGASSVLWEYSHANLGYTFSQPTIVRLNNGQWAAIFGNGYNSAVDDPTAQLFIVNLADGSLIKRIDTGANIDTLTSGTVPDGLHNGLSTPTPVDIDGDRITDYVYAGDLHGNLWKFDLTDSQINGWDVAYKSGQTPVPLFIAADASGNRQPITSRPEIGSHSEEGRIIYFGTGKYVETGDNTVPNDPLVQTFYGIHDEDPNSLNSGRTRSNLREQEIIAEVTAFDTRVRAVSANTVSDTQRGWYLDLVSPVAGTQGERVVSNPILRAGRVIFTTLIPDPDPCSYGGTSWLMELDAQSGGRLNYSVFDLNDDGRFNEQEYIELGDGTRVPVSGTGGDDIIESPAIVSAGEIEYKYASGSSGTIHVVTELGDGQSARQSWRQIQ